MRKRKGLVTQEIQHGSVCCAKHSKLTKMQEALITKNFKLSKKKRNASERNGLINELLLAVLDLSLLC